MRAEDGDLQAWVVVVVVENPEAVLSKSCK